MTDCKQLHAFNTVRVHLSSNNRVLSYVLSHLFQYRKGSTRTGGKFDPATGSVVCQFVYVIVVQDPMDLGCVVSDAWEVLADIRGNRGYPGSYALEALSNVQEEHIGTSGARYCRKLLCGP
jgi:hypothetical protein